MSITANWSYTNVATVRPFVSLNQRTGEIVYGEEFDIACTWTAESKAMTAANGQEFVSRHMIFTEDTRPKFLDLIQFEHSAGWEEIKDVVSWDMSFFNEAPDFKLVTG